MFPAACYEPEIELSVLTSVTALKFTDHKLKIAPVKPLGILGGAVRVCKGLDALLDLARHVQDTTTAIDDVLDWVQSGVHGCVCDDAVVERLEVWIRCDEILKGIPFVTRGDEARSIRSNRGDLRSGWLEGVCGPRGSGRGSKSGCNEGGLACLKPKNLIGDLMGAWGSPTYRGWIDWKEVGIRCCWPDGQGVDRSGCRASTRSR